MAPEHVLDVERRGIEALADARRLRTAPRTGTPRSGSTKRRISQGQAMRSIFGRARVTQTVRPCASRGGSFDASTSGSFASFQPSKPPSSVSADTSACRSQAAVPCASFSPRRQTTMAERPANSPPQSAACSMVAPDRAGDQPRVGGKILVGADVDQGRGIRRADQSGQACLEIWWCRMTWLRPRKRNGTRYLGLSPRGEIAESPCRQINRCRVRCQPVSSRRSTIAGLAETRIPT